MTILLFLGFSWESCEDAIEVEVPSEPPRLIVDAVNRIDLSSPSALIQVRVKLTSSFFGTIPVTGLTDINFGNLRGRYDGGVGPLIENPNRPGTYETVISTDGIQEGQYILQLEHEGRLYFARTHFAPAPPINDIVQGDATLFDENDTEVVVSFTDIADQDNFYVFDFGFGEYLVTDDQFYQGQNFTFSYFYDRNLSPDQEIQVSILGANQEFHNYMRLLIEQTEDDLGIFQTPAATVRGNVFDVTDLDNVDVLDNVNQPEIFPLGYFAMVQAHTERLLIE